MRTKLKNILYYGGLDKATYDKYETFILQEDMKNLRIYLEVTGLGFFVLGIVNIFVEKMAALNTRYYLMTAVAMLVLLAVKQFVERQHRDVSHFQQAFAYIYISLIYTEAIALTIQHPNSLAVTYLGALLMMPLLFSRRPCGLLIVQFAFTIIFCFYAKIYKSPEVAFNDIWNGISFLFVSIAAIVIVVPMRIKNLAQSRIIKELSEYDWLTGLKNRSAYEEACIELSKQDMLVAVVYADANGLHELNNSKGHDAGDVLLRAVSEVLKNAFGTEHAYRVGGDEFIVLCPDAQLSNVKNGIEMAKREIKIRGFSISFGFSISRKQREPLDAVCRRAEAEMYHAKAEYYHTSGAAPRLR